MKKHWYLPIGIALIGAGCFLFAAGCKNSQAAVNGVFTAEQTACMAATILAEDLTGQPEVIASDLSAGCQILPTLTQDVISFVHSFMKTGTGQTLKAQRMKTPILQ